MKLVSIFPDYMIQKASINNTTEPYKNAQIKAGEIKSKS